MSAVDDATLAAALEVAARALCASDRTEAEVRTRLARKGYADAVQDAAIVWLTERGYLSEPRVVARETERVQSDPSAGRGRLVARLEARGVDPESAAAAGAQMDEAGELAKARALLSRRRSRLGTPLLAARFLTSRGFEEEVVRRAVEEVFPDAL